MELDQERQALEDLLEEASSDISSKESEIQTLEQVGNYALGVTWKDGHYSIFAFDLLLQLSA